MWNDNSIIRGCSLGCAIALMLGGSLLLVYQVYQRERAEEADRCHAAQQTILDEAELIAAGGKFPGEQVTNRWKALLEGC